MFIGHFAAGFAAKRFAPRVSLGTAFIACQFLDLLWPILLLLGIENASIEPGNTKVTPLNFSHYPYSHSLVFVLLWTLLFGGGYFLAKRDRRGAVVLGALVLSHWLLDVIVHRPDLPIFPSGPFVGFGGWNSLPVSVILEVGFFFAGTLAYLRSTTAKNRAGRLTLAILIALLGIIYLGNLLGPPPPDIHSVAIAGNLMWLFVILAYWADKNRELRRGEKR